YMFTACKRRILCVIAILALIVCAVCVTALADNVKYDFSSYPTSAAGKLDPEAPEKGGWSYTATYTKGSFNLTNAEHTYGIGDQASRYGDLVTDLCLTYTIPAEQQVKIKDYGQIEFTRLMSNGNNFCQTYGSTFTLVLVMDDGQTIAKAYPWYDPSQGLSNSLSTVVDADIQAEIEALEGDPTLVKLQYYPYSSGEEYFHRDSSDYYRPAVADDPETEEDETQAVYNGRSYYFLTTYLQLTEAAAIPAEDFGTETDTWDGTETGVHNGKITGLDASKTYKYAPVHSLDSAFVTVTGVEAIENLVGGVYELRAVEEGKADSKSVMVVVPKTTQGSKNNIDLWRHKADGDYVHATKPVSGKWVAGVAAPYNVEANTENEGYYRYLASSWNTQSIMGKSKNAPSLASAEYYRKNIVAYRYALTPEEQFDVDEVGIDSAQFINSYYWKTNAPVVNGNTKYAIYVYTNGDTENPYVAVGTWKTTNSVEHLIVNASEKLDGYVTSIKYVHFYEIPHVEVDENKATTQSGYPLYSGFKTVALNENTFAPSATADKANTYKITGLDSNKSYNFSNDGKTWTVISNVTEITGLEIGEYYIQECAFATDAASEVFTFDIKGAHEFEGTPVADGLSIIGLDASVQYEYTTVTKL
ncbi:MAG: hypothetical protein IKV53_05480, partial [Clostridia bacterium]|nr:hypothetical protein [Clostridia bacterium]